VLELLTFGTDGERRQVCEELKDFETLPVNRLFDDSFDFRAWLRKFNNRSADEFKINLHFE
jgi:hypothetical protein